MSWINKMMAKYHLIEGHDVETIKAGLDAMSVGVVIGWMFGLLPAVATMLTIVWTGLRIYESVLNIKDKKSQSKTVAPRE